MLNIKLSNGDIAGDMVPTDSSPLGANNVPSVILKKGDSLYSPSGAFRFTLQGDGNVVLQNVIDATLNQKWKLGSKESLDPANDIQWNPVWATGTNDDGVKQLDMQSDGIWLSTMALALSGSRTQTEIMERFSECRTTVTLSSTSTATHFGIPGRRRGVRDSRSCWLEACLAPMSAD